MDLPPNVHTVRAKGRTYFYHQTGRNTVRAGPRTALGSDPRDPAFWAILDELTGTVRRDRLDERAGRDHPSSFARMVDAFRGKVVRSRGSLRFVNASPEWRSLAQSTQRDYSFYLDKLVAILRDEPAGAIRPSIVLAIRDSMARSPGSANHMLAVGKSLYAWGIPRDFAGSNPFRSVTHLASPDNGHWPWPDWAIEFVEQKAWPDLARFVGLSVWTGQRESDVVRLGPSARDGAGLWVRPRKTRKHKRAFWVPLLATAQAALDQWADEAITFMPPTRRKAPIRLESKTHYVLSPAAKPYTTTGLRSRWNRWLRTADGEAFVRLWGQWEKARRERDGEENVDATTLRPTLHGLRSTAVVHRRLAGYSDEAVANDIGMSMPMVRRYSRFIDQRAAAEINIGQLEDAKRRDAKPTSGGPAVGAVDHARELEQIQNMGMVDELRALAERMATAGGKRISVTPASAHTVAHALRAYADQLERPREEHPNFTVDVWSEGGQLIETMARCSSALVGRAAFEQAVRERERYEVTLRQGIRVVARHEAAKRVAGA